MKNYDHKKIEKKWQREWRKKEIYKTVDNSKKNKYYVLDMFPYPSGEGLHVGHPKGYIATDIISRVKRMKGFNVLHPMGFDAFGLPAENYAIKMKMNPSIAVAQNITHFKKQLEIIGLDYDWTREINTTDPKFYKWTQWIFLKLLEKGLAYESYEPINWCPSCKTGLANEDLEDGKCERCGSEIVQKPMRQWVLRITNYANKLLKDLNLLNWPESIKESQKNWIGKSEGSEIKFKIKDLDLNIDVFTTRADTIFGATYCVLAPEHKLVDELKSKITNLEEVEKYKKEATKKTEIERTAEGKEKTGVELKGVKAINPANNEELPIFIADYVLAHYGTGAIMAVPAHDERDKDFANKYSLPLVKVPLVNSEEIVSKVGGKMITKYRLRDWVFSRQRYWGEPIPIIHCEKCAEKKEQVLILHGWEGDSKTGFIPEFRKNLESKGYETFAFDAPDTNKPDFDEWFSFIEKKMKIHNLKDFHLVGYSMGGHLALKLAENYKLESLTLIAPVGFQPSNKYFNQFSKKLDKKELDIFKKFQDRKLNIKKIKNNTNKINFVFGKKDSWITSEIRNYYINNFKEIAEIAVLDNYGHMSENENIKKVDFIENLFKVSFPGIIPVPEKDLPVILPKVKSYEPTGTGDGPLADIKDWVNVKCPKCGGVGKRETNTMPQWAGSSWYYLRYMDPQNSQKLVDPKKEKYWNQVDLYVGGAEHATRHLIYARFWHKFLYDIGIVSTKEPFQKLQSVGLIIGEDGRKMSKRFGNVINPDEIVGIYGADTLRIYEMFMGPFDQSVSWSTKSIIGPRRFLEKIWRISEQIIKLNNKKTDKEVEKTLHKTIKKVTEDIENMSFNTAISTMMILVNDIESHSQEISLKDLKLFLQILAPFAPHITEEIWNNLGESKSIHLSSWPKYDKKKIIDENMKIVIQINGKVRAELIVNKEITEEEIKDKALKDEVVISWIKNSHINRIIYVPKRLMNIVI